MKNKSIKIIILLFSFSAVIMSCGDEGQSTNNNSQSNGLEENNLEKPKVEISGTYSGTDNVGMESTIILRSSGTLIIQASVGDGTPDYGNWSGTADNLTLNHKDSFGNDELIGKAEVTNEGLRIIGGNFDTRQ